jgi:hypothetical protein
MWTLYTFTNALTMWLTIATFVGYAIVYTLLPKPITPQNIVIGGASGAMSSALGWTAVTGHAPGDEWILVLIIFVWTLPHFCALAFAVLATLAQLVSPPFLIALFGPSCVLQFGAPESAFAQSYNLFFSHLLSTSIG